MMEESRNRAAFVLQDNGPEADTWLNSLPIPAFCLNRTGRFLIMNKACLNLFSISAEIDFTGKSIIDFCSDDDSRSKLIGLFQNRTDLGELELSLYTGNNRRHWIWLWLKSIIDKDNGGVIWIGCAADISKRKQMELSLQELDLFGRTVIENSPVGVSVRSPNGRLLAYNQAWQQIWGINGERLDKDLSRERLRFQFDQRDRYLGKWMPSVQEIYEKGGHLHIPDIKLPESDRRRTRWVSQHFFAIKNIEGEVDRIVILTEDTTDRKRAEEELIKSQNRYRSLVENAPVGIMTMNLSGVITSCNRACGELTGYDKTEIVGQHFSKIGAIKKADIPVLQNNFDEILSGKVNKPYEVQCLRKDGRTIWVEANINAIMEEGQVTGVEIIARDITHFKDAVEAFRQSEEQYRTLQANLPVGIFRSTPDGKILSVNPALVRMYGYDSAAEYLRTPAEDFYFRQEQRQELIDQLAREGSINDYEGLMRRKDGSAFWVSMSMRATFDDNRNMIYFDGIEQDITERKRVEESLAAANQEKYKQAKRIAGVFAHEIRNALFPAAAALNRLNTKYNENPNDLAAVKKYLAIAERAIASAADTTKLISAFSKLDTEIMPERVDLAGVVREIIKNNRLRIEELKVSVQISGSEDVYVTSNRRQLLLALGNLVLNSLQAFNSDRGHDLIINWNNNNGYVNLCIKDNGCGIPADELESIFELFFTARKDNDSCGIGLATARKIIEMYGGLIKVSSQFGEWTRFDIRLRAAMANHSE